jgi:hypothetical protein
MQSPDHLAEIVALEIQLRHYEKLLDQSIKNDEVFAKTKTIFHEMKKVYTQLENLKKK